MPAWTRLGQVLRDGAHQAHLAVADRAENDHAGAEALADRVHDRAQAVRVEPVDPGGYHRDSGHRPRAGDQILGAALREPPLELGELLLETLLLVEELLDPAGHLERRDPEEIGRLAERVLLLADMGQRRAPGDRLETADAGRDGALGRDLEEPDLAGRVEVRAPAELGREVADPDDPDVVPVLLAEERHRAHPERRVQVRPERVHRDVVPDGLVDQVLHPLEVPVLDRLAVGEVEAQPVGRHEGARLRHVGAEHLAEGGVQEVRARVVEAEPLAARRFHRDGHVLALAEAALRHLEPVSDQPRPPVLRVDDLPAPLPAGDDPGVADLAARLRIEGRAVEDHLDLVPGHRFAPPPAAGHHGEDPGRRGHRLVAEELRLGEVRQERLVRRRALVPHRAARPKGRARTGALPLRLHLLLVLALGLRRHRETALLEHLLGEVDREAVGVVEREEHLARHARLAFLGRGASSGRPAPLRRCAPAPGRASPRSAPPRAASARRRGPAAPPAPDTRRPSAR